MFPSYDQEEESSRHRQELEKVLESLEREKTELEARLREQQAEKEAMRAQREEERAEAESALCQVGSWEGWAVKVSFWDSPKSLYYNLYRLYESQNCFSCLELSSVLSTA